MGAQLNPGQGRLEEEQPNYLTILFSRLRSLSDSI